MHVKMFHKNFERDNQVLEADKKRSRNFVQLLELIHQQRYIFYNCERFWPFVRM